MGFLFCVFFRLHNFVVFVFNNYDVSWNDNVELLHFFFSFFQLVKNLILREFFNTDYNDFILEELFLYDGSTRDFYSRDMIISAKGENERLDSEINWDMQTFFLRLKLNLTEKMEKCRPQFFLKERSDDLANMKVYFFCIKCVYSV
jgi:hypothetical protein